MATAHPDNAGIQVFSRTQSAEQIEAALSGQGYEGFEAQTYSTAPIAPPEPPPAEVQAPPVETEEQRRKSPPGKKERLISRQQKEIETLRAEKAKWDVDFAELRGRIEGISSVRTAPVAEPAAVVEEPKAVEPPPVVQEAPAALARPKREQFFEAEDPDSAYEDAVADWKYDTRKAQEKAEETRQAKAAAEQARLADEKKAVDEKKAHQKKLLDRWNDAETEAKKEFADYDTVMETRHFDKENKPLMIMSGPMAHIARRMPAGPKILYWLGTHPEEANKLASKTVVDSNDEWAVEAAMEEVRTEFKRIQGELKAAPPPKVEEKKPAAPVVDDEDDDSDDEELESDPNIPVAAPADHGRKVEQPPAAGTVDTKPPAQKVPIASLPVGDKSEPVPRVGNRQTHVNRNLLDTPPEVLRQLTPDEYRRQRTLQGSSASRG